MDAFWQNTVAATSAEVMRMPSPDGKIALTGSDDTIARLWDTATGKAMGLPLKRWQNPQKIVPSPAQIQMRIRHLW